MWEKLAYIDGRLTALKEVKHRLTTGEGRTEAYEDTLEWIESELNEHR